MGERNLSACLEYAGCFASFQPTPGPMHIEAPTRIRHTYRQRLHAAPSQVFPLLCPVREAEWVAGWDPVVVYTASGYAEADCVFITPDEEAEAVWVVTEYDPDAYRLGFVKVTPGVLAVRIRIALREHADGQTEADVTYTYTALGEAGRAQVARQTEAAYGAFMQRWEAALNQHLAAARPG